MFTAAGYRLEELRTGVLLAEAEAAQGDVAGAARTLESVLQGARAGHAVTLAKTESVADGLMPVRPGDLTFAHVQRFVDRVVTVEDEAIVEALVWMFVEAKIVAEPSGAATVAAARAMTFEGPVVAIVSGGNVDPDRFDSFIHRSRSAGL